MGPSPQASYPLGILDSGIGGLSILRALQQAMPQGSSVYLGDSRHAPYGARGEGDILRLIQKATDKLLQQQIKLLVLGSSTITTVAQTDLRSRLTLPIVGTDSAVDLAVHAKRSNVVGVLCTRATAHANCWTTWLPASPLPGEFASSEPGTTIWLPCWKGETDTPAL